jgi:hypothetical protein
MQTPLTMWCRQLLLNLELLHDLHNGQASIEEKYFRKNVTKCNSWWPLGRFYNNLLRSQYLRRTIHVWFRTSASIMMKCGEEYDSTLLMHLPFGNQHQEPIQIMTSCNLENENLQMKKEKKEWTSFRDFTFFQKND